MHKFRYYGDPALRQQAEPVGEVTEEIVAIAEEMLEMLIEYRGAGIAANQIGVLKRIFVIRNDHYRPDGSIIKGTPKVYIDPVLLDPSEETLWGEEGCLSFPGIRVPVERPAQITIEATNLKGERFTETLAEWDARQLMHENDHLNGVLHIDRTPRRIRKQIDKDLRRMKKRYGK